MKCVCEGIDLSDAVLKVVKACSSKTTVPVLECIKLNAKNDSLTPIFDTQNNKGGNLRRRRTLRSGQIFCRLYQKTRRSTNNPLFRG